MRLAKPYLETEGEKYKWMVITFTVRHCLNSHYHYENPLFSLFVSPSLEWASLGIAIRKLAVSLHLHILDVNVHGGRSLVLRAQVGRSRRGHRGWESDNVQASMRWEMRIASLNVLGPWFWT